jgi:hypothetical protein
MCFQCMILMCETYKLLLNEYVNETPIWFNVCIIYTNVVDHVSVFGILVVCDNYINCNTQSTTTLQLM